MLEAIAFLIIGLGFLVWSADKLVYGAAALARNFGISPLVIGMTILAMGSSAPEMMVSATAALDGKTDTAVGNVLGSNIANIAKGNWDLIRSEEREAFKPFSAVSLLL